MSRGHRQSRGVWIGSAGLMLTALAALSAPVLAPHAPGDQFSDRAYAPPMRIHLRTADGFRAPFVYPQILVDRTVRQYRDDIANPVAVTWAAHGHVVSIESSRGPLLLLGADPLGRDVFSRLLYGARLSLGVTFIGALGALGVGAIIGGFAGAAGGRVDRLLMLLADFVLVLPGVYLVLVLRAALRQALTEGEVFWLMALLFAVAGWPHVARGVRAIVATERTRDYSEAARAAGAGPVRMLRHLLPATRGFLAIELVLLVPALLVAEATISYLGLGFPEPTPSWGTMLQDAANISGMQLAPWLLAPAAALFLVVLFVQLAGGRESAGGIFRGLAPMDGKGRILDVPDSL